MFITKMPFTIEILVLFLMMVSFLRILFITKSRIDSAVLLAPIAFVISVFEVLAWGLQFFGLLVLVVSFAGLLLNYRGLHRFFSNLYVDSYSLLFYIGASIMLIVLGLMFYIAWNVRPVIMNPEKFEVTVSTEKYSGSFEDGFSAAGELDALNNCIISEYKPLNVEKQKNCTVIIQQEMKTPAYAYDPLCIFLARSGYTVLIADIYQESYGGKLKDKLFRHFYLTRNELKENPVTLLEGITEQEYYDKCWNALLKIAESRGNENTAFYFIGDGKTERRLNQLHAVFSEGIFKEKGLSPSFEQARFSRWLTGFYPLSFVKEYKTKSFGFIEQTDPALAYYGFKLRRNPSKFAPSMSAYFINEDIKKNLLHISLFLELEENQDDSE